MGSSVFNKAMIEFLREHRPNMFFDELTKAFNRQFRKQFEQRSIEYACKARGIKRGKYGGRSIYTNEQLEWLRVNYKELTRERLCAEFNKHFKLRYSKRSIIACLKNHNIKSGRTGYFIKGQESLGIKT